MIDFLRGSYDMDFYLAAIPIQALFIIFYMQRRSLPLKDTRYFLDLMWANLAALTTDLVAAWSCEAFRTLPIAFVYLSNMIFFIAFLLCGYFLFMYAAYTMHVMEHIGKALTGVLMFPAAFMIAICLFTPFTGLLFTIDPILGYLDGPLYNGIYYCVGFYILASLIAAWVFREPENEAQVKGLWVCALIMLLGMYVRTQVRHTLVLSYFITIGIFIIYLTVRNPDLLRDHQTKLLNLEAFRMVMKELLKKTYTGFGIAIKDYDENRMAYGGDFVDSFLGKFGHFPRHQFPDEYCFYMGSGRFFVISTSVMDIRAAVEKVHERFRDAWREDGKTAYFDVECCMLDNKLKFNTVNELKQVIGIAFEVANTPGQDDVMIDEAYQHRVQRQFHVRAILEKALRKDSLEVYLQPIVECGTRRLVGAEALVRMKDDDGSIIGPNEFVDMASAIGGGNLLGKQVLRKTCAFIRDGGMKKCRMDWIHVNLSPVQCLSRTLAEHLNDILRAYHVPVSQIRLELTEKGAVNSVGLSQIEALRRLGYDLVLDDFGAGYSNAGRMKDIPFEGIKIDLSLVWKHFDQPDGYLPSLIETLHDLGFKVTAEGVETEAMVKGLEEMGCDYMQGFYFSKPIPMDEFLDKYGTDPTDFSAEVPKEKMEESSKEA